jgi:hypothetical protein
MATLFALVYREGFAPRLLSIVLGFWFLHGGIAHATMLSPGDSGSPDVFANIFTSAAQTTTTSFVTQSSGSLSQVSMSFAVYADPNNVFGAGDLDFLYQIQSGNGTQQNETISLVTVTSFSGFSTDAGYTTFTQCFGSLPNLCRAFNTDQSLAPSSVFRSLTGDTVGFNISIGTYPPASDILVIETNATSYSTGGVVTASGSSSSVSFAAFQPSGAAAVPEPASVGLLALGLAGAISWATRKRKRPFRT